LPRGDERAGVNKPPSVNLHNEASRAEQGRPDRCRDRAAALPASRRRGGAERSHDRSSRAAASLVRRGSRAHDWLLPHYTSRTTRSRQGVQAVLRSQQI